MLLSDSLAMMKYMHDKCRFLFIFRAVFVIFLCTIDFSALSDFLSNIRYKSNMTDGFLIDSCSVSGQVNPLHVSWKNVAIAWMIRSR